MSDRYMNAEACGIEPEREGEEPTLAQWRDRCRQLWKENAAMRGRLSAIDAMNARDAAEFERRRTQPEYCDL